MTRSETSRRDQPSVERAILLLAGRGRRLGPLTDDRPKCMVEVGGTPILERALYGLAACGVREVVLVVGYRSDRIRAFAGTRFAGLRVHYVVNERHSETNTAYSLWLAGEYLDRDVLLVEGDIVFDGAAIRRLLDSAGGQSAWAAVEARPGRREGILLAPTSGRRVRRVELVREADSEVQDLSHKCAGIQLLTERAAREFARKLEEAISNGESRLYADLVLGRLLDRVPVRLCGLDGLRWAEVDDQADLRRAAGLFDDGYAEAASGA